MKKRVDNLVVLLLLPLWSQLIDIDLSVNRTYDVIEVQRVWCGFAGTARVPCITSWSKCSAPRRIVRSPFCAGSLRADCTHSLMTGQTNPDGIMPLNVASVLCCTHWVHRKRTCALKWLRCRGCLTAAVACRVPICAIIHKML